MPRFTLDDVTVETSSPREAAQLRARGFSEEKAKTKAVREADAATEADADAAPAKAQKG